MRISEVRDEATFESLRQEWNALLGQSAADTIFLTHEWISDWWKAYGTSGELRILLARDERGELLGIAPLRRRTGHRFGITRPVLAFAGDGSADSDYLDFIIRRGSEARVMKAFLDELRPSLEGGTVLEVNGTPASSPAYELLHRFGEGAGMTMAETDIPCGTVLLPNTWDEYLKSLSPRFRTKIRSVMRSLTAEKAVEFELCTRPEQLNEYLPALYDLHTRRWARMAKPGVFGGNDKRRFYEAVSRTMMDRGWLFFSALRFRGKLLACQYGLLYGRTYLQLQEGYEPDSEHWNPGVGLRAWSIQQLIAAGITEYDFLAGVGRHKSDWGASVKSSRMSVIARENLSGSLYCRGPEWIVTARQTIKRATPDKWLQARDARQEKDRIAGWLHLHQAPSQDAGVPEWVRSVAASLYYHSPALSIAPSLRDRYVFRTTPQLRLERRSRPTLRIVYYHRINDENDPFLPSMPVGKFEEHIRFLAKHYRILSVREALHRLDNGGPPEPAVAVTFDDGYGDNYTFALPVLERYGVPATVFLTTGSLDLREPMWFEVLSVALKKSPKEHVDLELAVPRRFPLRTQADRLAANDAIFAWLRTLPDSERRLQLEDILRRLNAPPAPELSGRMLTWDQVRDMQTRGIDFGGHTVTHPFVSRLTRERAISEIGDCKQRIEDELQQRVEHFAYPSGRELDFQPWNKRIVAEAGYKAAVSTIWGVNDPGVDRMELRRGQPWEDRVSLFAAKLDWYQLRDE